MILADGWYRGQIGITRAADQWGDRLALLAQLRMVRDDGPVVAADLIEGEHVDLRCRPDAWDRAGFNDSGWDPVVLADHGFSRLVDSPAPPVRRVQEIVPVSVTRLDRTRQVVDLGQNINGWARLTGLGPAGTRITLTHGEWLGPDGDVSTENLRPAVPFLPEPLPAGQVDQVISAGVPGEVFEPRRTTHGFRYIRVEGYPGDLTRGDITGVVVHTDLARTGWFGCSDERVNRLHEAAVWSLRANVCDIPTDCPHRERAGWTGDWQLYVPTVAFLYDVGGFSAKWLRDVAADQWPDGTVANISPTAPAEGRHSPIAHLNGSAGWGDAAVIVPWEMYRAYGDVQILADMWPTMVRWLDRDRDAARYTELADRIRKAWQIEYLEVDGRIHPDTQAGYVRALAQTGHLDLAYELLLRDDEPSWLRMIDLGATTVWERWDGVDGDGTACDSLNHYSKGAVISFLHRHTAGIQLLDDGPGYRRFRIRPQPGGGLTRAEAAHESPYGRIESGWRLEDGRLRLRVLVPAGTQAEVVLPDGGTYTAGPGRHSYTSELVG